MLYKPDIITNILLIGHKVLFLQSSKLVPSPACRQAGFNARPAEAVRTGIE